MGQCRMEFFILKIMRIKQSKAFVQKYFNFLMYNNFNIDTFLVVQKESNKTRKQDGTLTFTIDPTPINKLPKNKINGALPDREIKSYQLFGQDKERITQFSNLLDKLEVALSDENRSHQIEKECEDEKEKENSDRQEITRPVNRYFSDVNSFDVMNKGVCSRCKKPGHFEKWCTEEPQNQLQCKFCLGNHQQMRCINTLCYKCNQFGHMAKDCGSKAIRCRKCKKIGHMAKDCDSKAIICGRCEKIGHKAAECGVIIQDKDWQYQEKNCLKKLKCMNCLNKGHINCNDFDINIYRRNNYKDDIYPNRNDKIKFNPVKIQKLNHVEEDLSIYSLFSEESPGKKRKRNSRLKQKQKMKDQINIKQSRKLNVKNCKKFQENKSNQGIANKSKIAKFRNNYFDHRNNLGVSNRRKITKYRNNNLDQRASQKKQNNHHWQKY